MLHLRPLPILRAVAVLLLALPSTTTIEGQGTVWFDGGAGQPSTPRGQNVLGGRTSPVPFALRDVTLLPTDVAGRTRSAELDPARPRLAEDVPGANRIVLPHGRGSVLHYRRGSVGAERFGFFWVDPSGGVHPPFERRATAGQTPFLAKVAVAPDGRRLLLATTASAGGRLFEVDLATGRGIDRSGPSAPLDVQPNGLLLCESWGSVLEADRVLRFERRPGAVASPVAFGQPVPFVADGAACSADGACVAVVAGSAANAADVWVFEQTGAPRRVTATPGTIDSPGYLPEEPNGPHLVLSADGSLCMWRERMLGKQEAWVRPVSAAVSAQQLTSDARFLDTLDATTDWGFFSPTSAMLFVGEEDAGGGVDGGDWYRLDVDPTTGAVQVSNLSLTSGVASQPFVGGELKTEGGTWRLPGTAKMLMFDDRSQNQGRIVVVDPAQTGLSVLRTQVASVDQVLRAGDETVLLAETTGDLFELYSVPSSLDTLRVVSSLPDQHTVRALLGAEDGSLAAIVVSPGGDLLATFATGTGAVSLLSATPVPLGPTIAFAGTAVAFSVELPTGPVLRLAWDGARVDLLGKATSGFVVPAH